MPSSLGRLIRILLGSMPLMLGIAATLSAEEPFRDVIDREIERAWEREEIQAAGPAADATFLRRVYLDLTGAVPTHEETVAFLDDADEAKREKLVDRLLADPRYAAKQATVWDLVLFTRSPARDIRVRPTFQKWLTTQFEKNTPYDQWAREILLAKGSSVDDGAPTFFGAYRGRNMDLTVDVARIFLGQQILCARCHDHPYEDVSQVDFYGMAAFYERLAVVRAGKKGSEERIHIGEKSVGEIMFTGPAIDDEAGQKGEPVAPKYLFGDPLEEPALPEGFDAPTRFSEGKKPPEPHFSRKDRLAEWIIAPENPYFARAAVNRIWAQYMGRGLVHPVDNMGEASVPSHPELLDAMAAAFVANGYDVKWLIREIVNSDSYQIDSRGSSDRAMTRWFERARVRPLVAEELPGAIRTVTGFDDAAKLEKSDPEKNSTVVSLNRWVGRYFADIENGVGDYQASLFEHLYLDNSADVSRIIAPREGNLLSRLLDEEQSVEDRVSRLYLTVLNRRPTETETQRFAEYVAAAEDDKARERVWHDAVWAVMNSSEFRFNH
ncbi:MAG: DUF1549 and DUF1553 domain-containing protein [Planctomycetaceae bacterium]